MRTIAISIAVLAALTSPSIGRADDRDVAYIPNTVTPLTPSIEALGDWHAPKSEQRSSSYGWGSFFIEPGAPIRPNFARSASARGSSGDAPAAGEVPAFSASPGNRLNCSDIGHPIYVGRHDPNHLDADGNGIGCQDW